MVWANGARQKNAMIKTLIQPIFSYPIQPNQNFSFDLVRILKKRSTYFPPSSPPCPIFAT
jgi:hypothetical protein